MKIGYLASAYPAVSHTFIRREVVALRAKGLDIETFSLRRTADDQVLSEADAEERERTWSILPASMTSAVTEQAKTLLGRPQNYLRGVRLAAHHRIPGARAALWRVFQFSEAIILAAELKRRDVEHLHSHFSNAGGEVGFLAAKILGIPWSVTLHGSADFDSPTRSLLGEKIAHASFVACVSYFGRALALGASDTKHWEKVFVARCGVDMQLIKQNARTSTIEKPERLRVLSVGRLSPEKGFVGLIDAFHQVLQSGVDAELRIVGSGPDEERIKQRARERGIEDRLSLPGHTNEAGVAAELARADLFVMSSFIEGLPVVLMEAMTLDVPVVAPRLAGIPELVEHGVSGLLFSPARWDELAGHIGALLKDPAKRQIFAKNGQERVAEEFEISQAVLPLFNAFQSAERKGRLLVE